MIARSHIETYSRWCGPTVLASVTGMTRYAAAAALWAHAPPTGRRRGTTAITTIADTLGRDAITMSGARPTVARWLRENPTREAVLLAARHFIHVKDGEIIADNGNPVRRGRVCWILYLDD